MTADVCNARALGAGHHVLRRGAVLLRSVGECARDRGRDQGAGQRRDKITDQQRVELFRTMTAYGGTYKFDRNMVEHHIDISSYEARAGTTLIRDFRREGDKLIYTTRPAPFPGDGKMSVFTVVWEKVK
jgi:Lipocalin-like domain